MPNPTIIHPESAKIRHYLAIAQFFIDIGQPEIYEIEPQFDREYVPDVYTRIDGVPIMVEIQRSHCSHRKMQGKVNGFVRTYLEGKHDAKTLWIVSNERYRLTVPEGFTVKQIFQDNQHDFQNRNSGYNRTQLLSNPS